MIAAASVILAGFVVGFVLYRIIRWPTYKRIMALRERALNAADSGDLRTAIELFDEADKLERGA